MPARRLLTKEDILAKARASFDAVLPRDHDHYALEKALMLLPESSPFGLVRWCFSHCLSPFLSLPLSSLLRASPTDTPHTQ